MSLTRAWLIFDAEGKICFVSDHQDAEENMKYVRQKGLKILTYTGPISTRCQSFKTFLQSQFVNVQNKPEVCTWQVFTA